MEVQQCEEVAGEDPYPAYSELEVSWGNLMIDAIDREDVTIYYYEFLILILMMTAMIKFEYK